MHSQCTILKSLLPNRLNASVHQHVVKQQNAEFISKLEGLQAGDLQGMRMGDKMYTALKMRLEMNIPYIGKIADDA